MTGSLQRVRGRSGVLGSVGHCVEVTLDAGCQEELVRGARELADRLEEFPLRTSGDLDVEHVQKFAPLRPRQKTLQLA